MLDELKTLDGHFVNVGTNDLIHPQFSISGELFIDSEHDEMTERTFINVSHGESCVVFRVSDIVRIDRANVYPHIEIRF